MVAGLVFAACALGMCQAFEADHYAQQSRLASGRWVKISVAESGIYRITSADARRWGFNDISRLRVYGYGGARISESLTKANYVDDLPQVAVSRSNDVIYFYGVGTMKWLVDNRGMKYRQEQHP